MNDFTKDELQKISIGLTWWFQDSGFLQEEDYKSLVIKIQSMIETYCEHLHEKWDSGVYKICHDCGQISW